MIDDLLWPLLGLLAAWPLWRLVQLGLVMRVVRGMRLGPARATEVAEADVPAEAREAVARVEAELAGLGNAPGPWYHIEGPFIGRAVWQRAFRGEGPTWALAQPADVPTPARPCEVLFTTVRADREGLCTMYGDRGRILGRMPQTTFQAGYPDTVTAHHALHEAALPGFLAGQPAVRLADDEQAARSAHQLATYADGLAAAGLARPAAGGLQLTWGPAFQAARASLRELAAWKAQQARLAKAGGADAAPVSVAEEAAAYARVMHRPTPHAPGVLARWGLFALSLVAFWLSLGYLGLRPDSRAAAWLVGALVLHEAGHLLAMKAFGYETPRMLFVPLLGAVTIGQPPAGVTARQQAAVLLAGPLPGLVLGTAALAWNLVTPARGVWLAGMMLVAVNLPNLFPAGPLDGGRLMALIAPRLSFGLVAAGVVVELAFAWFMRDHALVAGLFGALAAITAATLPWQGRLARLLARMPAPEPGEDRVATAFGLLRDPAFGRLGFADKLHLVKAAAEAPAPLRAGESAGLLAVMVGAMALPAAFVLLAWPWG